MSALECQEPVAESSVPPPGPAKAGDRSSGHLRNCAATSAVPLAATISTHECAGHRRHPTPQGGSPIVRAPSRVDPHVPWSRVPAHTSAPVVSGPVQTRAMATTPGFSPYTTTDGPQLESHCQARRSLTMPPSSPHRSDLLLGRCAPPRASLSVPGTCIKIGVWQILDAGPSGAVNARRY